MKFFKQLVAAVMMMGATLAFAGEGQGYKLMNNPQPVSSGNKIEVLEFFFYECPHCWHMNGPLSKWEKTMPKDVELKFVPVIFRESAEPMARTYYALEAMGKIEALHSALFEAIHVSNIDLSSEDKIEAFLASRGVDRAKFAAAYNSFSMASKVARSNQMVRDYGIRGTPTIIVDGKYVVSDLMPDDAVRVMDEAIKAARKDRSKH